MQIPAAFIEFRLSWTKLDLQLLGVLSSAVSREGKIITIMGENQQITRTKPLNKL